MKRLPQKGELFHRCTALPALLLLASLALMGILFLSDFGLLIKWLRPKSA